MACALYGRATADLDSLCARQRRVSAVGAKESLRRGRTKENKSKEKAESQPLTPTSPCESVQKVHEELQSFLSMRRMEARRRKITALRLRFSQSLASFRQRFSQALERSA